MDHRPFGQLRFVNLDDPKYAIWTGDPSSLFASDPNPAPVPAPAPAPAPEDDPALPQKPLPLVCPAAQHPLLEASWLHMTGHKARTPVKLH